jgi:hypothetical protein
VLKHGDQVLAESTFGGDVSTTNNPPVARDDTATTDQNTAVTIDVLTNDNDPLTIQSVSTPTTNGGTAVIESDDKIKYTPPSDTFTGTDTFDYTISDGKEEGTDSASVAVTVQQTTPSDTTPPVIEAIVDGTKGNNEWYTSDAHRHPEGVEAVYAG